MRSAAPADLGTATPEQVARLTELLLPVLAPDRFAYHFHDTRGAALDNVQMALEYGISIFDAAAGGLGGCPFAPGAPGNLATEALLELLREIGIETGVDVEKIHSAAQVMRLRLAGAKA